MKVIGIEQANLEECVRDAQHDRVVLMRNDKPVAVLVGVKGLDLEQTALSPSRDCRPAAESEFAEYAARLASANYRRAERRKPPGESVTPYRIPSSLN